MKKMLKPEIEFIRFNAEDVITTSGDPSMVMYKDKNYNNPLTDTTDKSLDQGWTGLAFNQKINQ